MTPLRPFNPKFAIGQFGCFSKLGFSALQVCGFLSASLSSPSQKMSPHLDVTEPMPSRAKGRPAHRAACQLGPARRVGVGGAVKAKAKGGGSDKNQGSLHFPSHHPQGTLTFHGPTRGYYHKGANLSQPKTGSSEKKHRYCHMC